MCVSVLNLGSIFDDDVQSVQSESRQSLARQPAQMKAPPSFSERLLEVYQPPFQPSSTPSHLQNRFMVRIITPSSPHTLLPSYPLPSYPPLLTPYHPPLTPSSPHTSLLLPSYPTSTLPPQPPPSPSLSPVLPSSLHLSHFLSIFSSLSHPSTTSPLHRYTIWWVWFVAMAMRKPQWWKLSSTIRAHTTPSACPIPLASPWQP